MSQRKIIAVDIDDVLSVFADEFVKYSNQKWGTHLTVSDYTEHWSKMWQIDVDNTNKRALEWYKSGFTGQLRANIEAKGVLTSLSKTYDIVITTSRHRSLKEETEDWVNKNYPGIFTGVHFAGIWDDHKTSHDELIKATKAELCKSLGANYLIDDQPKHCLAAAEAGINTLLFGDYPWNERTGLIKGVRRAANWNEVKEYFDEQS
jgi:uncharacterized HAD superfamily protein